MARKRSAQAHSKVLEAAERLFAERGIDATSMDAIAAESGVSKATIYKHWSDKDKLALEVLSHLHGLDQEPTFFETDDLRIDMIAQLGYRPHESSSDLKERMMPHLFAYSARNYIFGKAWRELVMQSQSKQVIRQLRRGIAEGEFAEDLDLDLSLAMLLGPLTYRFIFISGKKGSAPKTYIESVVNAFFRAFSRRLDPEVPVKDSVAASAHKTKKHPEKEPRSATSL